MSWSFSAVGTPEAVCRAIEVANTGLSDQSKAEWEEAKPALRALVGANQGNVVRVTANGSASYEITASKRDSEGTPLESMRHRASGSCTCTLEAIYGFVY